MIPKYKQGLLEALSWVDYLFSLHEDPKKVRDSVQVAIKEIVKKIGLDLSEKIKYDL